MFMEERHQKILEIINEKKRVEVQQLSSEFGLCEDSIRRDLRLMEEKGWVKRTYGGAILPEKVSTTLPVFDRVTFQSEKKEEIAQNAVSFINENDTILLDGSTTVARIVPHLKKFKKLTIVTNSILIAHSLLNFETNIKLFFLGGLIKRDIGNAISIETFRMIQGLNVDKVFMGVCAISAKWGLSTSLIKESHIKRAMIESGREVFLLTDSSKFGTKALAKIGLIKPDYTIITDSDLTEEILNDFNIYIKKGLTIIYNKKQK